MPFSPRGPLLGTLREPLTQDETRSKPPLKFHQAATMPTIPGGSTPFSMTQTQGDLALKAKNLRHHVIIFLNDEVVVQLCAAAWGMIMPMTFPGLMNGPDRVWVRGLGAVLSLAIVVGLQVWISKLVARYHIHRKYGAKQVMCFFLDVLTWQPRVSWALFGDALATRLQHSLTSTFHCRAPGLLCCVSLPCLAMFIITRKFFLDHMLGSSTLQYPARSVSLALLQFSAKIFYDSWKIVQEGFDEDLLHPFADEKSVAAALWSTGVLGLVTFVVYSQIPNLIRDAQLHRGNQYELFRLQKCMWFVCMTWASGFPDCVFYILVDQVGQKWLGSRFVGVVLMYLFSAALFMLCCGIATWHSRNCFWNLPMESNGTEDIGLEWSDDTETKSVKLERVRPGSTAFSLGASKFIGRRLDAINGTDAHTLAAVLENEASTVAAGTPLMLLFKSPDSVMQSMSDVLGHTTAAFVQNGMNNCFWWAFAEHLQQMIGRWGLGSSWVGGLVMYFIALGLTALSVAIFVHNRLEDLMELEERAAEERGRNKHHAHIAELTDVQYASGPVLPRPCRLLMLPSYRRPTVAGSANQKWSHECQTELGRAFNHWDPGTNDANQTDQLNDKLRAQWYLDVAEWVKSKHDNRYRHSLRNAEIASQGLQKEVRSPMTAGTEKEVARRSDGPV